ncbi:aldo/keto reductase [Rouxiella sp. WC2420]|uniref:Aldo/keto reductase n=1 Tax=Rouxiella sp. WC2420 TaxID=3234145 RepID=A0AB39VUJ6_9GAMM
MKYNLLGNSGLLVSELSFGTATFGGGNEFFKAWGATDVKEAKSLLGLCIDKGVNLVDSSDAYSGGRAEEILGEAIEGNRNNILISTKAAFRTGEGINDVGTSRYHLIKACEDSLRRLKTDHIDIWQMHSFDAKTPIEETVRALEDLVTAGKVRYIGCSNFSGWQLMKSLSISERHGWSKYVAHQAYYSLLGREYEWELMPLALEENIGTIVWSPLAGGRLSGKISRNKTAPEGSRSATLKPYGHSLPEAQFYDVIDVLETVAAETGKNVSQVALRWVLQRPTVSSVIIGARNSEQLAQNLESSDFELSADQMQRLNIVSDKDRVYPYWHQLMTYVERNPKI